MLVGTECGAGYVIYYPNTHGCIGQLPLDRVACHFSPRSFRVLTQTPKKWTLTRIKSRSNYFCINQLVPHHGDFN